jgi:hypothetical protein
MMILATLVGLASLVCFVMVLIKQFQTAGPLHGIIGLLTCGIWTGLIVLAIILNMMGGMAMLAGLGG